MIVAAQLIRRMRGQSGSVHLVAADWHYVVKPPSIGLRALLSEWLGARLLSMLGIHAADVQPIVVPAELAQMCWPNLGYGRDVVAAASSYPVDPQRYAVYDLLPRTGDLGNPEHLTGVLVVDLWTGRCEPRQHVFYRKGAWYAYAVDHKDSFGLCAKAHGQTPLNPTLRYTYNRLLNKRNIAFWLEKIHSIRTSDFDLLLDTTPEAWRKPEALGELRQRLIGLIDRRELVTRQLRMAVRSEGGLLLSRATA